MKNNIHNKELAAMALGFVDYASYLTSDIWKAIKGRLLSPGTLCGLCKAKPAYTLNHRTYDVQVLKGEDDSQLSPICDACHCWISWDCCDNFRNEAEQREFLDRIMALPLEIRQSMKRVNTHRYARERRWVEKQMA